jgi:elongation factor P
MERIVALIEYSEARKGMVIMDDDGQLYAVVDRDLKTPGNLPSKLRLRLKNLKTGLVTDLRVHPEDKVEQAYLEKRELEYLYKDSDGLVFMDTETFDQETLAINLVGEVLPYLKEGNKAQVVFHDGKPLSLELPPTVDLEVKDTDPGAKGAPGAVQYKPAKLETGLQVNVPAFINVGDKVTIDTRTGEYLGRAKG